LDCQGPVLVHARGPSTNGGARPLRSRQPPRGCAGQARRDAPTRNERRAHPERPRPALRAGLAAPPTPLRTCAQCLLGRTLSSALLPPLHSFYFIFSGWVRAELGDCSPYSCLKKASSPSVVCSSSGVAFHRLAVAFGFGFRVSGFGLPFFNVAVTTREGEKGRVGGGLPETGRASLTAVLLF